MALVFGDTYDWEGDESVKQALVFTCNDAKKHFEKKLKRREKEVNFEIHGRSLDSDCGAIFKLRAIKIAEGGYESIVRCAITGKMIVHDHNKFDDYTDAIDKARENLMRYIQE